MIHVRRVTVRGFKQLRDVDLALPRRGSVLVQGANESGKSTLFEAVYFGLFGRPLVAESGHAALAAVIPYGADESWVGLELTMDAGRRLRVHRHVRRGRPAVWQLDVWDRGGGIEQVRGNAVVNARIEAELRLDAEALLNTCFVEQKKLDKLEGLHRAQREQSLMKLLNLDRLLAVGDEMRVRSTDREEVARLRDRATLAALLDEVPALRRRLAGVLLELERVDVLHGIEAAIAGADGLARLERGRDEARDREAILRERVERAESLAAARRAVGEAHAFVERGREAGAEAERLAAALSEAIGARDDSVPRITARGMALRRLQRRLAWLTDVETERRALLDAVARDDARLAEIARDREQLNAARRDLVEARGAQRDAAADAEALGADALAFDVRAALEDWVRVRRSRASSGDIGEAIAGTERDRKAAHQRALGEAALTVLLTAAALGLSADRPAAAAVGAVLLVVLVLRGWRGWRRDAAFGERLWQLRGEKGARDREDEALDGREQSLAARLATMHVVLPATVDRAEVVLAEIEERLRDRERGDVREALAEAIGAQARALERVGYLERRQAELMESCGREDAASIGRARDGHALRAARLARASERRRPVLEARTAALGVAPDVGAIEGALGALRGELTAVRRAVEAIPDLERRLAERRAVAEGHWRAAGEHWLEARARARAAEDGAPGGDRGWEVRALGVGAPAAWSPAVGAEHLQTVTEAAWSAVDRQLAEAYEAVGGDDVRSALEAAVQEAGAMSERHDGALEAWRRAAADLSRRTAAMADGELALPEAPAPTDLASARDTLTPLVDHDADGLAAERDRLGARLNVVEHEIVRLRRSVGPIDGSIGAHEAESALSRAERSLAVREAGLDMVTRAGRNVMLHVLPSTLQHMRHLLPQLTLGRYFDAQLSDDYRIEVYDDRAGGWRKKDIFSGGTRDQFSLALRLAFALATLPEERGSAPSFLFLDEPLGAFDEERSRALIGLLTEGTLAESFDQVFLVSHVPIEPSLFDYRIVMDGGRVAESDLPEPEDAEA